MSPISEACGGGDAGRALVPGTLRGYRTWRLLGRRATAALPTGALPLTAVSRRDVRWDPTLVARCEPADPTIPGPAPPPGTDHAAPATGCVCGIYGWYDPKDTYMTDARVFGVVEASGVVIMGERGFRAGRARIAAVVTRNRRLAAACERAGIATYRRRRDLLRDYPPEDVSSLLGDPPPSDPEAEAARGRAVPVLGGFDVFVLSAIWVRAALIAVAFLTLPILPALATAAIAQVATMGLVFTRIRG